MCVYVDIHYTYLILCIIYYRKTKTKRTIPVQTAVRYAPAAHHGPTTTTLYTHTRQTLTIIILLPFLLFYTTIRVLLLLLNRYWIENRSVIFNEFTPQYVNSALSTYRIPPLDTTAEVY